MNLQLESDIEESDAINEVLEEVKDLTDREDIEHDIVEKEITVGDVFEALQAEDEANIDDNEEGNTDMEKEEADMEKEEDDIKSVEADIENEEGSSQDTMEYPEEQETPSEAEDLNKEIPDEQLQVASIKFLRDKQVVCITAVDTIVPGRYRLAIKFAGDLDDSLRGFYRTKHTVNGEVSTIWFINKCFYVY